MRFRLVVVVFFLFKVLCILKQTLEKIGKHIFNDINRKCDSCFTPINFCWRDEFLVTNFGSQEAERQRAMALVR